MKDNNIFLIRHGKTFWNREGRLQGHKNSSLLDSGIVTTRKIAHYLKNEYKIEKVYSSSLVRCLETTQIVCGILNNTFEERDALMECNIGDCEGLTWHEAEDQYPDFMARRKSDKWTTAWPNGEAYQDVYIRAKVFLQDIPIKQNVLIVSHEMFNKCFLGACLNWTPDQIMAFKQSNNELEIIFLENKTFQTIRFDTRENA